MQIIISPQPVIALIAGIFHANLLLFIHRKLLGGGAQGIHEEAVDIILHITEDCGMIGIGCYSLGGNLR